MYKLLITTRVRDYSLQGAVSVSIHTSVVEFEHRTLADRAYDAIQNDTHDAYSQRALKLYPPQDIKGIHQP